MKKTYRVIAVLMLLMLLVSAMSVTVFAESKSYTGTEGQAAEFWFHLDYDTTVEDCAIVNGDVPGMDLSLPNPAAVCLAGTPTRAGYYTVYISVSTSAGEDLEYTLTVSISEPESTEAPVEKVPVITKHPTGEKVIEGDSATFIARADDYEWCEWELATTDANIDCTQLAYYFGEDIKVTGADGEELVISNIPKELDGAYVRCRFYGEDGGTFSDYAKITVTPLKDATPKVTKNPTDETVDEGGSTSFIAKADYVLTYQWQLISPDGKKYDCDDAVKEFSGLKISGEDTETLKLSNIPAELDGFEFRCDFTAGSTVSSKTAKITVIPVPTEEEPTEEPTEEVAEEVAEEATEESAELEEKDEREEEPEDDEGEDSDGKRSNGNRLLIIIVLSVAVVMVAAIAGIVILKVKGLIP